jgi:hypothetical protein
MMRALADRIVWMVSSGAISVFIWYVAPSPALAQDLDASTTILEGTLDVRRVRARSLDLHAMHATQIARSLLDARFPNSEECLAGASGRDACNRQQHAARQLARYWSAVHRVQARGARRALESFLTASGRLHDACARGLRPNEQLTVALESTLAFDMSSVDIVVPASTCVSIRTTGDVRVHTEDSRSSSLRTYWIVSRWNRREVVLEWYENGEWAGVANLRMRRGGGSWWVTDVYWGLR